MQHLVIFKKVSELKIGDMVDLETCTHLKKHPTAEFEYCEVCTIDQETAECIAVGYLGVDVVGYDPEHKLAVQIEVYTKEDIANEFIGMLNKLADIDGRGFHILLNELVETTDDVANSEHFIVQQHNPDQPPYFGVLSVVNGIMEKLTGLRACYGIDNPNEHHPDYKPEFKIYNPETEKVTESA